MLNKAIAKWEVKCIHEVLMSTSYHLQSLRESKSNYKQRDASEGLPANSGAQHAMDWFILSGHSCRQEALCLYGTSFGPCGKQV